MHEWYAAPMEGLTGWRWRQVQHEMFGGAALYVTPFVSPNGNFSFQRKELEELEKAAEEATTANKALFDAMKDALDGKVKEVKVSTRLKDHPVCLSADGPLSIEMEKVLSKQPGSEGVKSDKVLELNVNHPVFAVLKAAQEAGDTEKLKKYSALLYAQAQLIEGLPVDDPAAYAEAVCSLMQ